MKPYTIEEQGMLKILEHVASLLQKPMQIKFSDIAQKTGIQNSHFLKLLNNEIIVRTGSTNKPVYQWRKMKPNIYMACETLKDQPPNYDQIPEDVADDIEQNPENCKDLFKQYPLNISEADLKYLGYNENEVSVIQGKTINISFETFWNLYDKKVGPKNKCEKKWNNLSDKDREKIMETLPKWLSCFKDKQFQPYPDTYLNNERWNDEIKSLDNHFQSKPTPDSNQGKSIKIIGTASEMSNLVGMYAFMLEDNKIKARIYITGKADNRYFICQVISPLSGDLNIAKLMTLDQLKDWIIIPNQELANEILADYFKNGWRYGVPF